MNSEIVSYEFGNLNVRVEMVDGEPWFVAKDVCSALELDDVSKAVSRLDDEEKGTKSFPTLGGNQNMTIINESGLYSLILRSNKPEAKVFKRWVTKEVLPSIRKTGGYGRVEVSREDTLESMMNQMGAGFEAISETVSRLAKRLVALESRQAQLPRQAQHTEINRELKLQRTDIGGYRRGGQYITHWTKEDDRKLLLLRSEDVPYEVIGGILNRSCAATRKRAWHLRECEYKLWNKKKIDGLKVLFQREERRDDEWSL